MKRPTIAAVLVGGLLTGALLATALPSILGYTTRTVEPRPDGILRALDRSLAPAQPAQIETTAAAPYAGSESAQRGDALSEPAMSRTANRRPAWREVTIPAGTALRLRLDNGVATDTARVEDRLQAQLAAPIVVAGQTVVPTGSIARGHVTSVRRSGKVKGRAYLALRFTELQRAGNDDRYDMSTRVWAREAEGTKKKDAVKIGVPAGVGAIVGGVVGGKKGAGIGAAVGGGAGTGVVLATRGKEVQLPRGSTIIVRLASPLTLRERRF